MLDFSVTTWTAVASGALCVMLIAVVAELDRLSRKGEPSSREPWLLRAPLLPLVLAVVAGLISIYSLILRFAFGAADFQLPYDANVTSPVLVAATLIAGTLTAADAVLRLRAHLLAEAKGRLDAHGDQRADEKYRSEQEVALTERFTRAVALLADSRPISRIAGVHLILALGDEWLREGAQQRCLDVLISHLRGLRENESFEDESGSRGVREEVRLISSEVLRRLSAGTSSWNVRAGDFSGAVLADFDISALEGLPLLDLRGAQILGSLSIPPAASITAPRLSQLKCEGDLTVEWADGWVDLDLSNAELGGSASLTGKVLPGLLNATGLQVGGDLGLGFGSFGGDVVLDSGAIACIATVGSSEFGATFGTEERPTVLSLVGTSFQELRLRRSERGPHLDLTDATGALDLSYSVFPLEVTANRLDASTGLILRGARFEGALVLDEAAVPSSVELDGMFLSELARSAVRSSEFGLRDLLLGYGLEKVPGRSVEQDATFDWRSAVEPLHERLGEPLMSEVSERLQRIEADLPLDWQTRPTFSARVMSEISRAVAKIDAPKGAEGALQSTLRRALSLAPTGGEKP